MTPSTSYKRRSSLRVQPQERQQAKPCPSRTPPPPPPPRLHQNRPPATTREALVAAPEPLVVASLIRFRANIRGFPEPALTEYSVLTPLPAVDEDHRARAVTIGIRARLNPPGAVLGSMCCCDEVIRISTVLGDHIEYRGRTWGSSSTLGTHRSCGNPQEYGGSGLARATHGKREDEPAAREPALTEYFVLTPLLAGSPGQGRYNWYQSRLNPPGAVLGGIEKEHHSDRTPSLLGKQKNLSRTVANTPSHVNRMPPKNARVARAAATAQRAKRRATRTTNQASSEAESRSGAAPVNENPI
ncbi:hypothetical protein F2Q68_00026761 [Brassica cretica]|uniref:Uncharacterized protein n=1 Tax=Brassica cretica TaxID=69181 RepID=A0A8S9I6X1_BRACR|nr:hypothetical protein F2Q68_00026761 [Brassica cretica]